MTQTGSAEPKPQEETKPVENGNGAADDHEDEDLDEEVEGDAPVGAGECGSRSGSATFPRSKLCTRRHRWSC